MLDDERRDPPHRTDEFAACIDQLIAIRLEALTEQGGCGRGRLLGNRLRRFARCRPVPQPQPQPQPLLTGGRHPANLERVGVRRHE